MDSSVLFAGLALLALAVVAVPFAKRLGIGGLLGYALAGFAVGPHGFGLFADPDAIRHVSELGVAMLLFLIGLELKPARLWVMRRAVFLMGGIQVAATAALVALAARAFDMSASASVVLGIGVAMSSTALVLPLLAERDLLASRMGRDSLGILLFQDLAIIPVLAMLPLLAGVTGDGGRDWLHAVGIAIACVASILLGGKFLVRPLFRAIDFARSRELFSAGALLIVVGTAALAGAAGLSMSLGAFLAGVMLSDSEYRHEIQADLEPFEGLLLGLFFASIGMALDPATLGAAPAQILGAVAAILAVKAAVLLLLAKAFGHDGLSAVRLAAALSQSGEFALVLFSLAAGYALFESGEAEALLLVVILSMAATPLMVMTVERLIAPRAARVEARPYDAIDETAPVIVCGFGRFGQIVGRVLRLRGIPFTALDDSAEEVEVLRRYGNKVYYGDPARADLLKAAGAESAKLLVVALGDVAHSMKVVETARRHFPHLRIYARARNRRHVHELMDQNVAFIVRETFHSSLRMTERVLGEFGLSESEIVRTIELFQQHDEKLLREQHLVYRDERALVQNTRQIAQELEGLLRSDTGRERSSDKPGPA